MPGGSSEVAAPAAAASWRRAGRGGEGDAVLWSGEAVFWSGRVRVIQVVVQPDSSRHTYVWPALGGGCAGRGGVMAPRRTRSGGGSGVVVGRSGVLVGKGQGDPGGGSA